jgi:hypothetical protein
MAHRRGNADRQRDRKSVLKQDISPI